MSKKIRKCPECGAYVLSFTCSLCGFHTQIAHPPRFSPQDKFGKYRREVKNG